jgi:hypothetical protein
MNNPPRTRTELVKLMAIYLREQKESQNYNEPYVGASDAMLKLMESWLKTDWYRLAEIFQCRYESRDDMVNNLAITMRDQLTNPRYHIVRKEFSDASYVGAADAMVGYAEHALGQQWDRLYATFNPEPRIVEFSKVDKEMERRTERDFMLKQKGRVV